MVPVSRYARNPWDTVLHADADLFVFATYTEGFPNAVLEEMSPGKPIVAAVWMQSQKSCAMREKVLVTIGQSTQFRGTA